MVNEGSKRQDPVPSCSNCMKMLVGSKILIEPQYPAWQSLGKTQTCLAQLSKRQLFDSVNNHKNYFTIVLFSDQ